MEKLTLKQKAFSKEYVRNKGNGTQAALKTYGATSEGVAASIASENLRKPQVLNEVQRQLDKAGMSNDMLDESTRKIIEAGLNNLKWTKPSVALQAIIEVNKLKDRYPASKHLNANLTLSAQFEGKDINDLKALMEELHATNTQLLSKLEQS